MVVNPGIVLISLITGPSLGEEEVDPRQALAVDGAERPDRQLPYRVGDLVVDLGGHVEFGRVVEVLGGEVVERVLATAHPGHPDLADRAGLHCAVGEFEHAALQFAAEARRPRRSPSDRAGGRARWPTGSSSHDVTRLTPIDEPPRAGLTNTGRPSRSRSSSSSVSSPRPQHHLVTDRQPLGGEQLLGELLVHARRAGQHARADVRHAGELEQALDGAVLAVRAVQDGEHDVDGGQHLTGRRRPATAVGRVRRGSAGSASSVPDVALTSGSRPSVIASVSGRASVSTQEPSGVMPTATHLEPLRVEVAQDAACGNAGDGVLGAASAVDDGDAVCGQSQPREATALS